MSKPKEKQKVYLIVAALLALTALQCILSMTKKSPTSDETPHLTAGYSYLVKGDYRLNREHPPLVKLLAALPLLGMNLDFNEDHPSWVETEEWSFGEDFMYNNRVTARKIIFAGRLPIVLLSLLLGFLVFRWSREIYGAKAGMLALFLYSFSPNILAHSRLVTFDIGITFFTALSLYRFYHFLRKPVMKNIILAGLSLGLALSTKFSAINILPMLVILAIVFLLKEKEHPGIIELVKSSCLILVTAIALTLVVYRISYVGHYFNGLKFISGIVSKSGMSTYLLGKHSNTGWWYYFIVAFLIKTPIPTVVLAVTSVVFLIKRGKPDTREYFLLVPVVMFLAASSLSRMQLGLRYILPVYPFVFIFTSSVMNEKAVIKKPFKAFMAVLLGWYLISSAMIFPHYLSYFNELAGGSRNGYKSLIDSNVDWGQDLPGLKEFLEKEGDPEIILSFFGSASPVSYGIKHQDFYSYNASGRREDHINSLNPEKEFFAISVNALQCLYFPDKTMFNWLKEKTPVSFIGNSIFVYDITRDDFTHLKLGVFYANGGKTKKAEREFRRCLVINPEQNIARKYLGIMIGKTAETGGKGK